MRTADALSVSRIVLAAPIALAIVRGAHGPAGALFLAAFATDFLDGWFARRAGGGSELGRILDPLADKVLVAVTLGALLIAGRAPAELCLVVVLRDAVLLAMGWLRVRDGGAVPLANAWGKVAFTALGVWMFGAVAGFHWPNACTAATGALYVAAGFTYATRLPAPVGSAAQEKR